MLAANMKVLLVMLLLLSGCRDTVKVVNLVCGKFSLVMQKIPPWVWYRFNWDFRAVNHTFEYLIPTRMVWQYKTGTYLINHQCKWPLLQYIIRDMKVSKSKWINFKKFKLYQSKYTYKITSQHFNFISSYLVQVQLHNILR